MKLLSLYLSVFGMHIFFAICIGSFVEIFFCFNDLTVLLFMCLEFSFGFMYNELICVSLCSDEPRAGRFALPSRKELQYCSLYCDVH